MDSRPTYDIRRQIAPLTSTDPSIQYYMEFTQGMMDPPEGTIFHETSIPMGRGIVTLPTQPLAIIPTMYTTAYQYTRPSVAFQVMSNLPSPYRVQKDPLDLPERPSNANQRLVRYTTNPPIHSHQRQIEINQLCRSQEELDSRLACLLSNHALAPKQPHLESQPG